MIRVVLDTNVIISALNFAGKPADVLNLAIRGSIFHITSEDILYEVSNVLAKKFSWAPTEAQGAAYWLTLFSKVVHPKERLRVTAYEPDNRILECAMEGQAQIVVSGDRKHLLKLKQYQNINILDATTFLE